MMNDREFMNEREWEIVIERKGMDDDRATSRHKDPWVEEGFKD